MKERHVKIITDFKFDENGVKVNLQSNLNGLEPLQKAFVNLIANRFISILRETKYVENDCNCRCVDLDDADLFNDIHDLVRDINKLNDKMKH